MSLVLWLSLGSLFLHQAEEYRYPGYFPGMVNKAMFNSEQPDRYPLNTNTAFLINVVLGWGSYLLAALFWRQAIWLAIATMIVSAGNIVAHTIIFNIKGRTLYNPGLITAWLLFAPIVYMFTDLTVTNHLISQLDLVIGLVLGFLLNYFGIFKMIEWMADKNTPYIFESKFLIPK